MPISRGMSMKDDALYHAARRSRSTSIPASWPGTSSTRPAEALDLDVVFERVLVDDGNQNLVFTVGKDGVLWKLDRKTGKYLGHKETVFQNVWERFDPQDRPAALSSDILEQQLRRVDSGMPEHGRRPQLAGVELSRGNERS